MARLAETGGEGEINMSERMSMGNEKMDSKRKHPFAITCRKCGSNRVKVIAFDYRDLELRCKSCGSNCTCGIYDTEEGDYS